MTEDKWNEVFSFQNLIAPKFEMSRIRKPPLREALTRGGGLLISPGGHPVFPLQGIRFKKPEKYFARQQSGRSKNNFKGTGIPELLRMNRENR